MVLAYLRERFHLRLYLPLAVCIAAAASPNDGWRLVAVDAGFALLLLVQFRLWDDLADRGRDSLSHPERVLVRLANLTTAVGLCGALGVLNICIAVWRDGSGVAVSVLAGLDAVMAAWYLARTRRTAAGEHLLLTKYPSMILIVAGARVLDRPAQILFLCAALYAAACAYEAWHDPTGPLSRRLSIGGHS